MELFTLTALYFVVHLAGAGFSHQSKFMGDYFECREKGAPYRVRRLR